MSRLEFNFQEPIHRPDRTAGWLLLLTGVALLIEMGMSYVRLQNDRKALDIEVQASHIRLDISSRESSYRYSEKEFEYAQQIISRLMTPWDSIFMGLESVKIPNVAILSVQPDIGTGVLQLEGEAKDYAAILTLVTRLRNTDPFSEVFLLRHEMKRDDPQNPYSFVISAHWARAP